MKTIITAATAAFLCVLLAGCAPLQSFGETNPATAQYVTDELTFAFIKGADNPAERAQGVREVVQIVRDEAETSKTATLSSLENLVRDEVDWDLLNFQNRRRLEFALLKARQVLSRLTTDGVLNANERATIGTFLDWVDSASQAVIARGA